MAPIPGPMPNTPAWARVRKFDSDRDPPVIIGASESAAAMGVCPYQTPIDLYLKKRGEWQGHEDVNEAMEMGLELEPIVLNRYDKKFGVEVVRNLPMYFSEENPFIAATPDAMLWDDEDGPRGIDAKTTTNYRRGEDLDKYGEEDTDQIPTECLIQGQQQCYVMEVDRVDFAVLFDGRTFRRYIVRRNEQLIAEIIKKETELFERIVNGDPPPVNHGHETAREAISYLYPKKPGDVKILSRGSVDLWVEASQKKQEIKKLKKEIEFATDKVFEEMEGAEFGRFPDGLAEVRRITIADLIWGASDVAEVESKVGQIKRKGYEYLRQRKVKK